MPDYELGTYTSRRLRYFDNQLLVDQDFIDEQKYHMDRSRQHHRLLHVAGIAEGLNVSLKDGKIAVSAGVAIDDLGRQVILCAEAAEKVAVTPATGILFILFRERECSDDTAGSTEHTRFEQASEIAIAVNPEAHALPLARVTISGATPVLDSSVRLYSGVALPGPGVRLVLRAAGDVPDLATLSCGLKIPGLTVSGEAKVQGGLEITGALTASGKAVLDSLEVSRAVTMRGGLDAPTGKVTLGGGINYWDRDHYSESTARIPHVTIGRLEVGAMPGSFTVLRLHHHGSGAAEFFKNSATLLLRETPGGNKGWFNLFQVENNLRVVGDAEVTGASKMATLTATKKATVESLEVTNGAVLKGALTVAGDATAGFLQLLAPTGTAGGKALCLELYQADPNNSIPETHFSIRFHHSNRFYHRFESRASGFHFLQGDMSDTYVSVAASAFKTSAGTMIGCQEGTQRLVRGIVNANGDLVRGGGFTVSKCAGTNRRCRVNFTPAFSDVPVVFLNGFNLEDYSLCECTKDYFISQSSVYMDFHFIAIGPA